MTNDIITKTNDGYVVEVFAKKEKSIDDDILEVAEGLSILEPKKHKTEEEYFSEYKEILEKIEDRPVTIKALEKGKDLNDLKCQFRAILRACLCGDLSVAIPKISSVEEMEEIKDIIQECKNELEAEKVEYKRRVKIGAVIEIPSAALMSYELAKECDFFFIDTDSLTSYSFGGKQNSSQIVKNQLATIKLIRQAVRGAHDAGIFCGVSGGIAEEGLYIPLLLGLGIDEYSVEAKNIENVRKIIAKLDRYDCREFAKEVLDLTSLEHIENKLKQFLR